MKIEALNLTSKYYEICPVCNGSGEIKTERHGRDFVSIANESCGNCKGSGKVINKKR